MSDKLQEDFNIYYLELKNFTENFKDNSHGIETDKLLSRADMEIGEFARQAIGKAIQERGEDSKRIRKTKR